MALYLISLFVLSIFIHYVINAQYTSDPCRCDAECEGERDCMFFEAPFDLRACEPADKGADCSCISNSKASDGSFGFKPCSIDFDCDEGDVCEPSFTDKVCSTKCGINRENCPEPFKKKECDFVTEPEKPTVTPKPSKQPKPSKTPSESPTPALPSLPPTPVMVPAPTLLLPMETPEGSPGIYLESPEPTTAPEATTEETSEPMLKTPKPKPQKPKPPVEGTGTGLTRDECTKLADCVAPRKCIKVGSPLLDCEPGDEECNCSLRKPLRCESDDECVEGEQCFDGSDGRPGSDRSKLCVSNCSIYKTENPQKFASSCDSGPKRKPKMTPTVEGTPEETAMETATSPPPETATSPTPEPTDAICVAAEELKGVQKVFDRDFHAWVLCDADGSCATPGHMVVWNGEGMMMKSYCDVVGCEKKVMAVNSPRFRAGGVSAKTIGLFYTSFAARWETNAEERVLAAIVRLVV